MYVWGMYNVNLLPRPGLEAKRISPPKSRASSWLTARPSPVPPSLRPAESSCRLRMSTRHPAGAEGGLKVIAADRPVEVEDFTGKVQVRDEPAFHRAGVNFG